MDIINMTAAFHKNSELNTNKTQLNHSEVQLTSKQARGVIAVISLLSWSEAISFT